jgi:hypothetical protein
VDIRQLEDSMSDRATYSRCVDSNMPDDMAARRALTDLAQYFRTMGRDALADDIRDIAYPKRAAR